MWWYCTRSPFARCLSRIISGIGTGWSRSVFHAEEDKGGSIVGRARAATWEPGYRLIKYGVLDTRTVSSLLRMQQYAGLLGGWRGGKEAAMFVEKARNKVMP